MSISQSAEPLLRTQSIDATARPAVRSAVVAVPGGEPVTLSVDTDLDRVAVAWRAFEREADGTAFQTFGWQSAWQRHIGALRETVPAIVIGRGADGAVLFLLALAVEPAGPVRRLTWLASDLCDYNGPLLAPDFTARIGGHFALLWEEIGRLLRGQADLRHDAVVLEKMPEKIGAQPNPFLGLGVVLNPSGAYLTHIPGDFDSFYVERRSAAKRKSDRWKQRRLAHNGAVVFHTAEGAEDIDATLDALFAQKTRSLVAMGAANIFANPGQADFYRAVAKAPGSIAHVSRLDVGESHAAANLGLAFRGRYYHVLASYCDGELARFGPGATHLQYLMRHAVEKGCGIFDFTIGDEPYKREWCDTELALYDLRRAVTPLGVIVALPSLAVARTKRFIKQTPALWRIALKVRALLGAARRKTSAAPVETASEESE